MFHSSASVIINRCIPHPFPLLTLTTLHAGLAETIDIEHHLLNKEIKTTELAYLAIHFDDVVNYMEALGLTDAQQTDVKTRQLIHSTQAAMTMCLSLWQRRDPAAATYRALVKLLKKMRKHDIASKVFSIAKKLEN